MEISNRLKALASLVDSGANVFDVGCDHGFLSIYLSRNDHEVVASDITPLCIKKTKYNIEKEGITNIKVIQSDGLDKLDIDKKDNIVIAGMGAYTIIKILKKNINKLSDTLIIQSNNNHDILRKQICKLGYYIDQEIIVKEKYIYLLIKFKRGHKKYKKLDYLLGINNDLDYKNKVLNRYTVLYKNIPKKYILRRFKTKKIIKKIEKNI